MYNFCQVYDDNGAEFVVRKKTHAHKTIKCANTELIQRAKHSVVCVKSHTKTNNANDKLGKSLAKLI